MERHCDRFQGGADEYRHARRESGGVLGQTNDPLQLGGRQVTPGEYLEPWREGPRSKVRYDLKCLQHLGRDPCEWQAEGRVCRPYGANSSCVTAQISLYIRGHKASLQDLKDQSQAVLMSLGLYYLTMILDR